MQQQTDLKTAFNETPEEKLKEFEAKYLTIKIKDEFDKEGYAAADNARKEVKKARISVDKIRKELNEDALKWQKTVNAKAKELTVRIEVVENHLEAEIARIDNIAEIRRNEEIERERLRIEARKKLLFDAGMTFNGEIYVFESIEVTPEQLGGLADNEIQDHINLVIQRKEQIEAANKETQRIAAENAEKEKQLKEREERLNLNERTAKLKEIGFVAQDWEKEMLVHPLPLQVTSAVSSKQFLKTATEKEFEEFCTAFSEAILQEQNKKFENDLFIERGNKLIALGYAKVGDNFISQYKNLKNQTITVEMLKQSSDEAFDALIESINKSNEDDNLLEENTFEQIANVIAPPTAEELKSVPFPEVMKPTAEELFEIDIRTSNALLKAICKAQNELMDYPQPHSVETKSEQVLAQLIDILLDEDLLIKVKSILDK